MYSNKNCPWAQLTSNYETAQDDALKIFKQMLIFPFEQTRLAYSTAVKLGVLPKSMVTSSEFHKNLASLEKATLGVFARQR